MPIGTDGFSVWTSDDGFRRSMQSTAWNPGPSLDYYKRGAHKLSDVYANCNNCPARYWIDSGIHMCLVKKEKKDPYMEPTCTEQEWDLFVLEYV